MYIFCSIVVRSLRRLAFMNDIGITRDVLSRFADEPTSPTTSDQYHTFLTSNPPEPTVRRTMVVDAQVHEGGLYAAYPPMSEPQVVDSSLVCDYCSRISVKALQVCSRCKTTHYCGAMCQRKAWKTHKAKCTPKEK